MKKQTGRAVAEICGGVIGAGFASGREIAAFFSRFGMWSWPGVILAGVVMGWICRGVLRSPGVAGMPRSWLGTWRQWLWQGMFTALLGATGASMLAGGGEIAALVERGDFGSVDLLVPVPMHPARLRDRGRNHALCIAQALSRETGIPVWTGLVRTRNTRQQARLSGQVRKAAVETSAPVFASTFPFLSSNHVVPAPRSFFPSIRV